MNGIIVRQWRSGFLSQILAAILLDRAGRAVRAFLAFIQHELKPYIRQAFSVDPKREAFFGHSYGGLFTLNTLFTCRPYLSQYYYASSPSVWWNEGYINSAAINFLQV
ncbi:MAG: alpha/beta hydrolase-fold protein [Symbiopectobacterium sp.]